MIFTAAMENAGDFFVHGCTMRDGGSSRGPYASLNLGLHVGDDPDAVMANRRKLAESIGIPLESFVFCEQVHGGEIAVVGESECGAGTTPDRSPVARVDGLVTSTPGTALGILTADCATVYFVDCTRRAVGLVHAGWRGTAASIAARAVAVMGSEFGTEPHELVADVGPSIGPCCYQVGADVYEAVTTPNPALSPTFEPSGDDRWQFDLKRANQIIVGQTGVPTNTIHVSDICTACDRRLFSYRRDGPVTGRSLQFIAIRE